jgi:hypothetical protein
MRNLNHEEHEEKLARKEVRRQDAESTHFGFWNAD